jgi:hypothetical protein
VTRLDHFVPTSPLLVGKKESDGLFILLRGLSRNVFSPDWDQSAQTKQKRTASSCMSSSSARKVHKTLGRHENNKDDDDADDVAGSLFFFFFAPSSWLPLRRPGKEQEDVCCWVVGTTRLGDHILWYRCRFVSSSRENILTTFPTGQRVHYTTRTESA